MPTNWKPHDPCKWGGPKWQGILQLLSILFKMKRIWSILGWHPLLNVRKTKIYVITQEKKIETDSLSPTTGRGLIALNLWDVRKNSLLLATNLIQGILLYLFYFFILLLFCYSHLAYFWPSDFSFNVISEKGYLLHLKFGPNGKIRTFCGGLSGIFVKKTLFLSY